MRRPSPRLRRREGRCDRLAPVWHALGFHILALDLRAHGESAGVVSTAGDREQHDVVQVLDQLRADGPAQTRQLVLFGVSLGAAVALAVAADGSADAVESALPSGNGDGAARRRAAPPGIGGRP